MRKWLQKIGLALVFVYATVAGFSALYFNYRVAQTRGFIYWVMFGEVEATIRGALWPYFTVAEYQTHQLSTDTSLSDSDWTALERVLPTLKKPTFDSADLDTGRAVLDGFTARTGHRLNAAELEAQLRFNQEILEWRAEASASIAASWQNGAATRTPRYVRLTEHLGKYPAFADDLQLINKVIDAAAKHEESMTINGQTVPVYRLGEMENPYRQAVAGYDTAIAGLLPK